MLRLRNFMLVACMATAALTAFSCSQEDFETTRGKGNTTITATFEGTGIDTRTTVNDQYKIVWQSTDALALFCTDNTKSTLAYLNGEGTTSATFNGSVTSGKTASFSIYPDQTDMTVTNNTLTMILSATLTDYAGSSNGPMYAKVTDPENLSALSFKHMAALIKLTVNKIPADATAFKITASNNIAGTCTADLNAAEPVLTITDNEQAKKEITATFTASSSTTSRSFYIPLPIGTYQFITAQLTDGSDKVYFTKTLNNKTLNRRDLLEVPALDCITVEATTPSALNSALADEANLPQAAPEEKKVTDIAVTGAFATEGDGTTAIEIPVVSNSDINLAFNTVPTTTNGALLLTDKNKEGQTVPSAEATNKVSVAIPEISEGATAPSVSIDMPRTTVTLSAVGTSTTYNEVTATTAQQTLVINAGVTVKKLIIKGGNVEIYGTVEELVRDAANSTEVKVTSFGAANIKKATNPENFTFKSTWDGISKVEATDGNIYTAAQLAYYQSKTAPNDKNYQSLGRTLTAATTTLHADIDLANKPWLGMVIDGKIFDGQSHIISNLNMSQYILNQQETTFTPQACIGLFAAVYGAATIKNITLDTVTIRPDASTSPKWVGALVGYSRGNVTNYENCIAKNVDIFTHGKASYRVGGLIGYIEACGAANNIATAVLKGCKVEGATIAASFSYGGLVGSMYDSATLEDCSTSNIILSLNGDCDTYGYVSNFIGDIANNGSKKRTVIIKNCTTDVLSNESALKVPMGGCKWCGIVEPVSVANFTIKVTENNGAEKTLVAGTDFNIVRNIPWDGISSFEPKSEGDTYSITAPSELAWVAQQVEKNNTFEGKTIKLCANLDMGDKSWKPIGDNVAHQKVNMDAQEVEYLKTVKYFKGTFDGDNKTISNLTVNHKYPGAGLFGNVQDATIKNLIVTNATINGSSKWTAIVIGYSNGNLTIENVKVSNSEINMESDTNGAVKLAGLVSYMNGNKTGDIHLKGCSVSDFAINGAHYNAAGLAGYILGAKSFTIENCQTSNISITRSQDTANIGEANFSSAFLGCFTVTTDSGNASNAVFKNNTVSGKYSFDGSAVGLGSFTINDAGLESDSNYDTFACAPLFGDHENKVMDITIDDNIYTFIDGKYTKKQ